MNIIIIISILIISICILIIEYKKYKHEKSLKSMIHFKEYLSVLHYHMDKAYAMIYKDKILIYSTEGIKITDKQFAEISKQFANLVLKMIGNNLKNEFLTIYGDDETFLFNVIEFFNSKYEEDEIQKSAADKIMNKEIDSDEDNNLKTLFT